MLLPVLGFLLLFTIGAGVSMYVRHVYQGAKAAGAFSVLPKPDPAHKVRSARRRAPATVRLVAAQAVADNWVARRAHKRTQKAAKPKGARRPLLDRLVFPGTPAPPPAPSPPATTAKPPPDNVRPIGVRKTAGGDVPQKPAPQPVPRPRPQPVPDPAPGKVPPMTAPVMAHKSPPPPDHAAVIARIAGFEPGDDAELLRFMTGECAAMAGYADAMGSVFETCVSTVGLDPSSVAGLSDYATAMADAAETMRRAHAKFYAVYQEVMEAASKGVVLPHKGRWITGAGA